MQKVLITKLNQIGDVTFALPLASALKKFNPNIETYFMGREYTRSLIEHYQDVDKYIDGEALLSLPPEQAVTQLKSHNIDAIIHINSPKDLLQLASKAEIPIRIGNARRLSHWRYCNKHVWVKRKNSPLHESQLDMQFLKPLTKTKYYGISELIQLKHFKSIPIDPHIAHLLSKEKFNLILHPKTRGQHIEWPIEQFADLIQQLPHDRINVIITGSLAERSQVAELLFSETSPAIDGMDLPLDQLLSLIANADGLIAASTGPVHLASSLGISTLGLYAPIKPFDAARWGPIGKKATTLSKTSPCSDCRISGPCHCIASLSVKEVLNVIGGWLSSI